MDIEYIIMIVFAFSMISERLANLIKLYLPTAIMFLRGHRLKPQVYNNKNISWLLLSQLNLKQENEYLEMIRKRIILTISLICGLLIATVFQDVISALLKNDSSNDAPNPWLVISGFGMLFSFGSKFWHDILDFILFSKNIHRRVQDINLPAYNSAAEVKIFLQKTDQQLLEETIQQYHEELHALFAGAIRMIKAETTYHHGEQSSQVVIYVEEDVNPNDIHKFWVIPGSNQTVPIKVVGGLGEIKAQYSPGTRLWLSNFNIYGTMCCLVNRENDPSPTIYALTCGHVITGGRTQYHNEEFRNAKLIANDRLEISVVDFGLEDYRDYALLAITPYEGYFNNDLHLGSSINNIRILDSSAINEIVYLVKHDRHLNCRIVDHNIVANNPIRYDDGNVLRFANLISITHDGYGAPTVKGDSGSLVYDEQGNAIGMVIGADNKYTYLQSMNFLNLSLHISPLKNALS
jgi:hypothetical protein